MKRRRLGKQLRERQVEGVKLEAGTCLRQAQRGRQVVANLTEFGYGG